MSPITPAQEMKLSAGVPPASERRTGRTTRMLWRVLLLASETDHSDIVIGVHSQAMQMVIFDVLRGLAKDFIWKVVYRERVLLMVNGSKVQVLHMDLRRMDDWERKLAGREARAKVFVDHCVSEFA